MGGVRAGRASRCGLRTIGRATIVLALGFTFTSCNKRAPVRPPNHYKLESVISFGQGGEADPYKVGGWSYQERDYTWTEGHSAKLQLWVGDSRRPLGLRVRLSGMTRRPERPLQPVHLYVNGEKLAEWHIAETVDVNAIIPVAVMKRNGQLNIELETPLAISPKALGTNEDPRVLGVACHELEISKAINFDDIRPQSPTPASR